MSKLHDEAKKGRASKVLQCLQTEGVDSLDQDANTPLLLASGLGHLDVAKVLIENGANVNHANRFQYTALMSAARNVRHECVELLLQSGADPYAESDAGYSALMLAANYANAEMVNIFLSRGVDPNWVSKKGVRAIFCAVHNEQFGHEVLSALLKAGADAAVRDKNGLTPLERAIDRGFKRNAEFLSRYNS